MQDIAGDWTGIFWVFLILMVLPVLWTIASKTEFEFPLPGVITLAGYCFLSAMYAPQLFALGQWGTGRIENIMYDMFLILTVVLEFYWIGWIQKKTKAVLERRFSKMVWLLYRNDSDMLFTGIPGIAERNNLCSNCKMQSGAAKHRHTQMQ